MHIDVVQGLIRWYAITSVICQERQMLSEVPNPKNMHDCVGIDSGHAEEKVDKLLKLASGESDCHEKQA